MKLTKIKSKIHKRMAIAHSNSTASSTLPPLKEKQKDIAHS